MKALLFLLMLGISPIAGAAELSILDVTGNLSPNNGFTANWFEGASILVVNIHLGQLDFQPVDDFGSSGLDLKKAKTGALIAPALPLGCALTRAQGLLNRSFVGTSPLSFNLKGESCQTVIEQFKKVPIELSFDDVPGLSGSLATHHLHIRVADLPTLAD